MRNTSFAIILLSMFYVTGGYDTGGMMIEIGKDGKSAKVLWTDSVLDVHHGGVVLLNGYIYGANWINNGNGNWCCIEWNTGKKMWEEPWNCKGSIISADPFWAHPVIHNGILYLRHITALMAYNIKAK